VDGGSYKVDLPDGESGIFFANGLDSDRDNQLTDLLVGHTLAVIDRAAGEVAVR
jgi:hypothetical protein